MKSIDSNDNNFIYWTIPLKDILWTTFVWYHEDCFRHICVLREKWDTTTLKTWINLKQINLMWSTLNRHFKWLEVLKNNI